MLDVEVQEILRGIIVELTALTPVEQQYIAQQCESPLHTDDGVVQIIFGVEDRLSYIMLYLKYLQFEFEATKRENAFLRRILNETKAEDE